MKTWTAENPKGARMTQKHVAIVNAALRVFLECGYAQASMDRIAGSAGVSVKTVYRHFENKDDLFVAVMQAACDSADTDVSREDDKARSEPSWFSRPPRLALAAAGEEYLTHQLSPHELALYRVVACDAHRFPMLGQRYRAHTVEYRNQIFIRYLERWAPLEKWKLKDPASAAEMFAGLLRTRLFEDALLGIALPTQKTISLQARRAATCMLTLLESGNL